MEKKKVMYNKKYKEKNTVAIQSWIPVSKLILNSSFKGMVVWHHALPVTHAWENPSKIYIKVKYKPDRGLILAASGQACIWCHQPATEHPFQFQFQLRIYLEPSNLLDEALQRKEMKCK